MFGCAAMRRLFGFAMDQIEQLKQDGGQRTPRASGLRQQTEVFESIEIDGREFKRKARLIYDPHGTGCGGPDSAVVPARDFH